jgi:hypothetical protein
MGECKMHLHGVYAFSQRKTYYFTAKNCKPMKNIEFGHPLRGTMKSSENWPK